ncbi:TetR/AcrR family transcriptional regulator [Mycobacterium crocinum]|uniref:TetR/AcrR family transcriptional regulator n=2 Tax=Mycolicibacterium TaxID=1866885 RepID=A0ABX8VFJ9_9MYCO|nr:MULTISPECIES: TetR/AcrR family transcriptional regulator [Mycolicibacterium]APE14744.1 TetR family transcriptional regulator [Mycobacterium sp. WY10]MCV7218822.1 TetR/AcrR family transcriptional regulator [Mycolicibacterium crocinum]QYL14746.1 TetR/AcrR family transcriptional regulator [Mycolicibacterium pallens]ULN39484.1 TetR/AcrR family transcriptional regulator [Mycolicibacterium crocinum]
MGKRQDARQRIEAQIVELGRRQLATEGAAGLSVRAIARELGMVSSAVYRYVASRDALLTLLLVDAYSDLADSVGQARAGADGSWRDDVATIARAIRNWALDQPAEWALLYGSPVPGYHAPAELTTGPGTRVIGMLFDAVATGVATGDISLTEHHVAQPMSTDLLRVRDEFGFPGDDALVIRCTAVWAMMIGAVSLEVFGQYGTDTFTDPRVLFDQQIELAVDLLTAGPQN